MTGMSWAVTSRYIDGACTFNGDGTAIDCAAGVGQAGPYNSIHAMIAAGEVCDSTYNIRGIHASHGSNHAAGTFDGRYFGNEWVIDAACTDVTPLTIQPNDYAAHNRGEASTGEVVYLDGTRCPKPSTCTGTNCDYSATGDPALCGIGSGTNGAWIQCTWDGNCDCGGYASNLTTVGDGSQTACQETWVTEDASTAGTGFQGASAGRVLWAQKDDGSVTYSVGSLADLTNTHGSYVDDRCSTETWIPCTTEADCLDVFTETCTATSPEIDCFRDNKGTTGAGSPREDDWLICRWGTGAQAPGTAKRPYVSYGGDSLPGVGFTLKNSGSGAQYITIQGFNFRAHTKGGVYSDGVTTTNNTIHDNRVFYVVGPVDEQVGSDYGFTSLNTRVINFTDNEIAYTLSECWHATAREVNSPTVMLIRNNYCHNIGDAAVLGPYIRGTPVCMTIGGTLGGTCDYSGSYIEGNYCRDILPLSVFSQASYGIQMEHCPRNIVIRDNVLLRAGSGKGMLIDASTSLPIVIENQEWYNNLIIDQGGTCFEFYLDAGDSINNIKVYNNTCVNPGAAGITMGAVSAGNATNVIFRNNLLVTDDQKCINWTKTSTTNLFEYNLCDSSAGTAATWLNTGYSCLQIDSGALGPGNHGCPDPVFEDSSYSIAAASPAKDAGTSLGMPDGRTEGIDNLFGWGGVPGGMRYGSWDIGAYEFYQVVLCCGSGKRRIITPGG